MKNIEVKYLCPIIAEKNPNENQPILPDWSEPEEGARDGGVPIVDGKPIFSKDSVWFIVK